VASITADTADDVGGVVLLLRAVILAMSNLAAVLAGLVFVITQSSVQGSKLTKLVTLELVLALGNGCGRFNDVVDQLLGLVHLFLGVGHDETVQVLFLVARMCSVRTALALLHGALSANGDFGARFRFHLLECVATRADEQSNFGEEKLSVSS